MTITEARQAIAAVLTAASPGLDVRPRPVPQPTTRDGWVVVTQVAPATFQQYRVTLTAVICLGQEAAKAEQLLEELTVPLLEALTRSDLLLTADVTLTPETIVAGNPPVPLYALAIAVTVETGG